MTGGPDAAVAILETIAVSMVSLATLVLTITMVVVQLAMGQFSPRIVQTFLQDRPSQVAIGLFVATFAHAMLARPRSAVRRATGQVPGVAIIVAYVLVLTSIAMLVLYVHHIGRSLRVSALIELVGNDTRRLLDRHNPDQLTPASIPTDVIAAPKSGVLIGVDHDALVAEATAAGCVLHVVPGLGGFVPAGAPLVRIDPPQARGRPGCGHGCVAVGLERTLDEDLAYGFRMLVDMAERSLSESPFMNPTTAVQCIDRLHDGLRQLATRRIFDGHVYDVNGTLRVVIPSMDWDGYVHLAFDNPPRRSRLTPSVTPIDRRTPRPTHRCATPTACGSRRTTRAPAQGRQRQRTRPDATFTSRFSPTAKASEPPPTAIESSTRPDLHEIDPAPDKLFVLPDGHGSHPCRSGRRCRPGPRRLRLRRTEQPGRQPCHPGPTRGRP